MPLFSTSPKSICVLRLSAIGDVCNAVAAVQAIQRQWPETQITWITGKLEAQLIEGIDNVRIVIFNKQHGWKGYRDLWHSLKDEEFDALLHMQYALRASIATLGIKAKYKLGFDAQRSQDFQTWFTNVKVPSPSKPHVLDGLLAFAKAIGVNDLTPAWTLTYSESDRLWSQFYLTSDEKQLVIVPAASKGYKNWTATGYAEIIDYVQSQGWNVILAGSPASIEVKLAHDIEQLIPHSVTNLVGKSSLKEMLALIDQANLVIAPDTGPTHMANAMRTPVIGLYAHHNPQRTGPYLYRDYVVSVYQDAIFDETGKNPEQLNWRTRVKDKEAMKRIKAEDVIAMFNKMTQDFNL